MNETKWSENIILVDAEYIDKVAFDLTVNFERMLGRRIPPADLARWIDCVALDGGMRETPQDGNVQETLVALIHDKGHAALRNYVPSDFSAEINGKAFRDHLGEFTLSALPVESLTTKDDFFLETLELACAQKEVKRIMVVCADSLYNQVCHKLRRVDDEEKRITIFGMEPHQGSNFRQEILGYSIMAALGISSREIEAKI
jgi:hypothetical protein